MPSKRKSEGTPRYLIMVKRGDDYRLIRTWQNWNVKADYLNAEGWRITSAYIVETNELIDFIYPDNRA